LCKFEKGLEEEIEKNKKEGDERKMERENP